MTEPRIVVRHLADSPGRHLWLWCPGCVELHSVQVADEQGGVPSGPVWQWDGDLVSPTIEPSIKVQGGRQGNDHVCHSFVRAGVWEFLADSTHALAGQHFEMGALPGWMSRP